MIACRFSVGKEKNLSFIPPPPLTDSVNPIIYLLTDFEKTLFENIKAKRRRMSVFTFTSIWTPYFINAPSALLVSGERNTE